MNNWTDWRSFFGGVVVAIALYVSIKAIKEMKKMLDLSNYQKAEKPPFLEGTCSEQKGELEKRVLNKYRDEVEGGALNLYGTTGDLLVTIQLKSKYFSLPFFNRVLGCYCVGLIHPLRGKSLTDGEAHRAEALSDTGQLLIYSKVGSPSDPPAEFKLSSVALEEGDWVDIDTWVWTLYC